MTKHRKSTRNSQWQLVTKQLPHGILQLSLARIPMLSILRHIKLSSQSSMKNKQVLQERIKHPRYDGSALSDFENFYIGFCIVNKLFLNFHIHDDTCEAALRDFRKLNCPGVV